MTTVKHYELQDKLGEGGMGTVYRGQDTRGKTSVAIKVLKSDAADPDTIVRFLREGESLRQLNHPNIVKLLDAIEENGRHYLVMELVEGGSLADIIAQQGRLSISRILPIALDLADALTRAHRLNIIHRDLKPANILIAADGTPRLTDFGIALTRDSQITETGVLIGTVAYLSPELLTGGSASVLSDIWAFGVVLFEMLTGTRPFQGDQFYSVMNAIINTPIPDLEALCADAPTGLIDLIYRMMSKNPGERIPSVRLVGAELEALLQGRKTTTSRKIEMAAQPRTTFVDSTDTATQNNLPKQTTPFVGRDVEVQTMNRLLADLQNRLVTIIGPGGMGKTRLSLEIAAAQLPHYPNGVYFVELAPLSRADDIPMAIADAVQYPFQNDGRSPGQQILDYLREKQQFLVMDNFEHIIEGRTFVQSMLQHAPQVKILVTSRERLNLSGETLFPLEGMSVPTGRPPEEILTYAAVKLFMQSARRVHLDYKPSHEELPVIGEVCRKVFGMPLGIVLAASWLELLSVQEINDEISRSLDFLETTMQDVPERQRSLRALFDYSWQRLTDDERQAFSKLSLFHGGMTREAAQAVSGASLRHLQTLVNKSLLRRANDSGRYEIHELLRQYAEEYLKNSGEWAAVRERHAAYFADFVAKREADIKGKRQLPALQEIEVDFDNIKAAWHRAIEQRHADMIDKMMDTLYWFTQFRSRFQEGAMLFRDARTVWLDESMLAGRLLVRYPDQLGTDTFKHGLQIAQKHGNSAEIAFCTRLLGHWLSHIERQHDEGIALLRESHDAYTAMGDTFYAAMILDDLGWSYGLMGQRLEQRQVVKESVDLRRAIGDVIGVCNSLRNMGGAVGGFGNYNNEALVYWQEALELAQTIGDRSSTAWNLFLIGALRVFDGELEEGMRLAEKAYSLAAEIHDVVVKGMALLLKSLYLSVVEKDYEKALQLRWEGYPPASPNDIRGMIAFFTEAVALLGLRRLDGIDKALITGLNVGLIFTNPPVTLWCLPAVAVYLHLHGEPEWAAEVVGLLKTRDFELGLVGYWEDYQCLPAALETALGTEVYKAAFERGRTQTAKQLVEKVIEWLSG